MVLKWFLNHQWKQARRSPFWQKSLAINIVLGFFVLLILLELLGLGLLLNTILSERYPDQDLVMIFNSVLLYYLAIDLILRYLMQSLPVMAAEPYFHLPDESSRINFFLPSTSLLKNSSKLS